MKIIIYATTQNGEGFTEKIGELHQWDELLEWNFRAGMFNDDVVITFEQETEVEEI